MSHSKKISICQMTLVPDANKENFEDFMRTEVFPRIRVGEQTRVGIVTAQYLLKVAFPEPEKSYSWIVEWEDMGGSLFGPAGAPEVPVNKLESLGACASQRVFEIIAEDRWTPSDR